MTSRRLLSFLSLLLLLSAPTGLWAKKHHTPTPEPTATETATPTETPIPYTGPKLYTFDTLWGSKGSALDQLYDPEDIDVSPQGRMVIADTLNNRVVIWDENGKPVTAYGTFGTRADWQNAPQFNRPSAVYVHPKSGKLYVADTLNQRIVVLDDKGLVVSSWGTQGKEKGQFNLPRSIAQDHFGNIWVLDSGNSRVQIFSGLGQFNSMWGAFGDPTSNTITAQLKEPLGMAINAIDQALIADTGNFRFQVLNNGGVPVTIQGWYGEGPDQFKEPGGVAITPEGLIAVTDGTTGRVEFFNNRFEFKGQWSAKDDILTPGYHPHYRGISSDGQGRLYLTDIHNNQIVRIRPIKAPESQDTPTAVPPTPTPLESDPYGGAGFPIR